MGGGGEHFKLTLLGGEFLHFPAPTPESWQEKRKTYKESLNYSQIYCIIL